MLGGRGARGWRGGGEQGPARGGGPPGARGGYSRRLGCCPAADGWTFACSRRRCRPWLQSAARRGAARAAHSRAPQRRCEQRCARGTPAAAPPRRQAAGAPHAPAAWQVVPPIVGRPLGGRPRCTAPAIGAQRSTCRPASNRLRSAASCCTLAARTTMGLRGPANRPLARGRTPAEPFRLLCMLLPREMGSGVAPTGSIDWGPAPGGARGRGAGPGQAAGHGKARHTAERSKTGPPQRHSAIPRQRLPAPQTPRARRPADQERARRRRRQISPRSTAAAHTLTQTSARPGRHAAPQLAARRPRVG